MQLTRKQKNTKRKSSGGKSKVKRIFSWQSSTEQLFKRKKKDKRRTMESMNKEGGVLQEGGWEREEKSASEQKVNYRAHYLKH